MTPWCKALVHAELVSGAWDVGEVSESISGAMHTAWGLVESVPVNENVNCRTVDDDLLGCGKAAMKNSVLELEDQEANTLIHRDLQSHIS